jgi:hypothetical protein
VKTQDLAAYFSKKIAKPIIFAVRIQANGHYVFWVYEIEVTAVEEETLHVLVNLKGTRDTAGRWLVKNDVSRGDMEIPMREGDYVSRLLGMAVAVRGLGERCEALPEADSLRKCYREYLARADEQPTDHLAPRM